MQRAKKNQDHLEDPHVGHLICDKGGTMKQLGMDDLSNKW